MCVIRLLYSFYCSLALLMTSLSIMLVPLLSAYSINDGLPISCRAVQYDFTLTSLPFSYEYWFQSLEIT